MQLDGISVIICCYNSEKRLPQTLFHLAQQTYAGQWEIIIVDNNCTDNTVAIAKNEWQKYNLPIPLRIIVENQSGLSYARRAGILNAQYKYAIFCDDDNWLDMNYLQIAYDIMEAHPEVGLLGGQSKEVCEIEPPEWFDKVKHNYAVGKQAEKSGFISSRLILWGAGLVIRTKILVQLYLNNIVHLLSDRSGTKLSSGGDSELCFWFHLANYQLYYEEKLFFYHFIPSNRIKSEYYRKLMEEFDIANKYIYLYRTMITISKLEFFKRIRRFIFNALKILFNFFRGKKKKYNKQLILEIKFILPILKNSEMREILNIKKQISKIKFT